MHETSSNFEIYGVFKYQEKGKIDGLEGKNEVTWITLSYSHGMDRSAYEFHMEAPQGSTWTIFMKGKVCWSNGRMTCFQQR